MNAPEGIHRCWAEVDLTALRHNAAVAKQRSGTAIMAVVKANAYGHGAIEAMHALKGEVALFGVANLREAEELRANGVGMPVLLLGPCLPAEEEHAIKAGFHLCVSSLNEAAALNAVAERVGKKAEVHLVVDTGMGRMGFTQQDWTDDHLRRLQTFPHLRWEGIASHLPSPDEDAEFTRHQIASFIAAVTSAKEQGLNPPWIHLANSAGLLGYEAELDAHCTLSRPGLMLYGVAPLPEFQDLLKPVLTWKTRVTLVRELPAGHGVSYGRTYITPKPTRVATLACGYADGYPRQASNQGASVLISGRRCPLLGRVTMDQMMVDVSALVDEPLIGAEAVLLGHQGDECITANELASQAGTISWHIFTGIGARVERVYRRA